MTRPFDKHLDVVELDALVGVDKEHAREEVARFGGEEGREGEDSTCRCGQRG